MDAHAGSQPHPHLDPRLHSNVSSSATASSFPALPNSSLAENPGRLPWPARAQLPPLTDPAQPPYDQASSTSPSSAPRPSVSAATDGSHDAKRPRACEACRGLKVRCESDLGRLDGPCRRCAKAGRNCVVTAPTRKRQRRTDTKVAELEKKIDALTASLHGSRPDPGPRTSLGDSHSPDAGHERETRNGVVKPSHQVHDHAEEAAPSSSWLRQPDALPGGTPQPGMMRESAAETSVFGLKRKYSEGSQITTASPDARMSAPLPRPAAEGSSPARDNAPSMYPFLIPKPVRNGTPSTMGSDSVKAKTNVDAPRYEYADAIDRRILSAELAASIFDRYVNVMTPHFPAVVFPPGTTAAEIRKTRSTLFLAILSVASGASHPAIQKTLTKEIMKVLADRIVCNGEKSIEIIQALHVVTIWYWPPEHHEELKFYQLIHMAAVMAVDMGIGRRQKNPKSKHGASGFWREHPWRKTPCPHPESTESRRTWLTCYYLCASVSMSLRRPNLIRWTPYVGDCVDFLESSPEALQSDRHLCQLVRLQQIAEDVGVQLSMDDPCALVGISDIKVQYALKGFERQLDDWQAQLPKELDVPAVRMHANMLNLYIHEVAIHVDHNVDDFKPTFGETPIKTSRSQPELLNHAQINALTTCLSALQAIVGIILSYDTDTVRVLPIFNFVRVAYAVVCLTKLHFAVTSPNSELGKVISREDLKVEQNLDGLLEIYRMAAEGDKCRPASKFLMVLLMLKTWFQKQKGGSGKDNPFARGAKSEEDCFFRRAWNEGPKVETPRSAAGYPPSLHQGEESAKADTPSHESQRGENVALLPGYSTANTPLQLLSEVAMGNSNGLIDGVTSSNAITSRLPNGRQTPSSGSGWYGYTPQDASAPQTSMEYSSSEDINSTIPTYGMSSDIDLEATMGGGFGQALGMTLGDEDFPSMLLDEMFFSRLADGSQNPLENWA